MVANGLGRFGDRDKWCQVMLDPGWTWDGTGIEMGWIEAGISLLPSMLPDMTWPLHKGHSAWGLGHLN